MADLALYRKHLKEVFTKYANYAPPQPEIETYTIFDQESDHYQVVTVGWENGYRMYGCLIHADIKNDKIWIQYDGTEYSIAQELIDRGIPPQDIVLAYHAPYARKFTEFAIG